MLEKELLSQAVPVAVYFAYQDDYLEDLHKHIQVAVTSDQAGSAFEGIVVTLHLYSKFGPSKQLVLTA